MPTVDINYGSFSMDNDVIYSFKIEYEIFCNYVLEKLDAILPLMEEDRYSYWIGSCDVAFNSNCVGAERRSSAR